jgi:hypothetical protein
VARSRHKNFVELNRCATPYGILIQPDPLEKRFRGGVDGWPALLGGGKGNEGPGTGWNEGQRGGAGVCHKRFWRDGRISAWEPQPTSHGTVMLIQVASREETGALMVAPFGVEAGRGLRPTSRSRSADTAGQPAGVHPSGHRDSSPV